MRAGVADGVEAGGLASGAPISERLDLLAKRLESLVSQAAQLRCQFRVMLAEVFNVFNRANYGSYNTTITNASFGTAQANSGNAYVPRSGQLGVRVTF